MLNAEEVCIAIPVYVMKEGWILRPFTVGDPSRNRNNGSGEEVMRMGGDDLTPMTQQRFPGSRFPRTGGRCITRRIQVTVICQVRAMRICRKGVGRDD